MKNRHILKTIAIILLILNNNSTKSYSLINLPSDLPIWRQFINKPREKNLYSSTYFSTRYARRLDKSTAFLDFCSDNFFVFDFAYYFSYKAFYLKLRVPTIIEWKRLTYHHIKQENGCILKNTTGINLGLGYNIIYKKKSNLGLKLIASVPTSRKKDGSWLLIDYDDLWGIGAGVTGSRVIWKSKKIDKHYLEIFFDAKARYMSGSKFYKALKYSCNEKKKIPTINWFAARGFVELKINTLVDVTIMLEYIRKNWIFDAGYTFYAAMGIKTKNSYYRSISKDEYEKYSGLWEPREISHNAFLAIGYAWKKEDRSVIPFAGITIDALKTPCYKTAGISLKGGITF